MLKETLKKTVIYRFYHATIKIRRIIRQPSFFPEYKRKSVLRRYYENYKWLMRFKKYNPSYNLYGLDVENLRDFDDYIDVRHIKRDRALSHHEDSLRATYRKENITTRYSLLADDKHLFYTYMYSLDPKIVPKLFFVFQGEKIIAPFETADKKNVLEAIKDLPDGKYVCKATIGAFGDSVMIVETKDKHPIINNGKIQVDEFIRLTGDEPFLLQEFIVQHEKIGRLNPDSVNTIRIISTRWNEDTHILAAMIRIGIKGQIVDNASNGGTFVGIDTGEGKLKEFGYYYDKPRERSHPDTNAVYKDFSIPYWKETIALIKRLHPVIFGFSTIGWDVAITETGPIIVEMNWNYSIKGIQIANEGLRKRWEELKHK